MIYLNSIIISIIITIAFYTDKTMHKIYDNEGNYNLINSLPQIFVSNISTEIITKAFEEIIDFQEKFIDLKKNIEISYIEKEKRNIFLKKDGKLNMVNINQNSGANSEHIYNIRNNIQVKNSKDKQIDDIKISFRRRSVVFYFIILIFNIFGWYYASCFSAVFKNTQKHLLKDLLYSIPFNLIVCILKSLIKLFIQLLKRNEKCTFMKYTDKKIVKCIINEIIPFIIEMIMEYYIIYLVSKVKINI